MPLSNLIQIVTVDDHPLFCNGIEALAILFEDLIFVGNVRSGEEAIALCQDIQPDVVLMDMRLTGMDGIETTIALQNHCPQAKVIILTSFCEGEQVNRALQAGAVGYLLKDISKEKLVESIRFAHQGMTVLSPEVTQALRYQSSDIGEPESLKIEQLLTCRQQEVLALIVQGYSNTEIADQLGITVHTAKAHVSHILRNLNVSKRIDVVRIVMNNISY